MAAVTGLKNLALLSLRGRTVLGTVIRNQPAPRGTIVTIRVLLDGRAVEFDEPCLGFGCDQGEAVPVTMLPSDPTVHAAGSMKEQVWTALIATFLVAPLMFGGGTAFSLWAVANVARSGDVPFSITRFPGLRYLPVLASLGVLISSVAGLVQGRSLARFQIAATVCLVAGSVAYLVWLRRGYQAGRLPLVSCVILFACGLALVVVGLF